MTKFGNAGKAAEISENCGVFEKTFGGRKA